MLPLIRRNLKQTILLLFIGILFIIIILACNGSDGKPPALNIILNNERKIEYVEYNDSEYQKIDIIKKSDAKILKKLSFGLKSCCFNKTYTEFQKNIELRYIISDTEGVKIKKIATKCCGREYVIKETTNPFLSSECIEDAYFLKYFLMNNIPFIIHGYYCYFTNNKLIIVYEYLTTVLSNISFIDNFDDNIFKTYTISLFLGIYYLHKHNIIHRDIKPDNIGISATNELRIFDFDVSVKLDNGYVSCYSMAGTPFYMAPEAIENMLGENNNVEYEMDWYAFGVTLYVLLEGNYPRDFNTSLNNTKHFEDCLNKLKNTKLNPLTNKKIPDDLKSFIEELIEVDRNKRLGVKSVDDIINHRYFKRCNIKKYIK